MPIALCVPPPLASPATINEDDNRRTALPGSAHVDLTVRGPVRSRVSAEGWQFGVGAGNETMLVTAISLATDATLLADDRQIVNLPAQRGL